MAVWTENRKYQRGKILCQRCSPEEWITLISVVMTAPDYKVRFSDAAAMLNLGFGSCQLYTDSDPAKLPDIPVEGGVKDQVSCSYKEEFRYLDTTGASLENVEKKIILPESVQAPVLKETRREVRNII